MRKTARASTVWMSFRLLMSPPRVPERHHALRVTHEYRETVNITTSRRPRSRGVHPGLPGRAARADRARQQLDADADDVVAVGPDRAHAHDAARTGRVDEGAVAEVDAVVAGHDDDVTGPRVFA